MSRSTPETIPRPAQAPACHPSGIAGPPMCAAAFDHWTLRKTCVRQREGRAAAFRASPRSSPRPPRADCAHGVVGSGAPTVKSLVDDLVISLEVATEILRSRHGPTARPGLGTRDDGQSLPIPRVSKDLIVYSQACGACSSERPSAPSGVMPGFVLDTGLNTLWRANWTSASGEQADQRASSTMAAVGTGLGRPRDSGARSFGQVIPHSAVMRRSNMLDVCEFLTCVSYTRLPSRCLGL